MSANKKNQLKTLPVTSTTGIRVADIHRLERFRGRLSKVEMIAMLLDIYESLSPEERSHWQRGGVVAV